MQKLRRSHRSTWLRLSRNLLRTGWPWAVVRGLAFSADGQRLVTGAWSGEVKVWDTASGQEVLSLNGHVAGVGSVAFSADGKRIAAQSQYGTVKLWDAQAGRDTLSLKSGRGDGLSFSLDGCQLAAAAGNTAFICDATPLPEKP